MARSVLIAVLALLPLLTGPATAQGAAPPADVLAEVIARFDPGHRGPLPDHVDARERCLTPLLSRVRAVASQLAPADAARLRTLDPALALAIDTGRGVTPVPADDATVAMSNLPAFPDLDRMLTGKDVVVHYTLDGDDAVPNDAYAAIVLKFMDKAAKKLTKAFRRPYYEPADDGADLLHVFIMDIDDPDLGDALGFAQAVSDVSPEMPKSQTSYIGIANDIQEKAAAAGQKKWKKLVKSTCFHEYMHAVQQAYNSFYSSWAVEGQAVWIESSVARVHDDMAGYLADPESILKSPGLPLWHDSIHKYSTAPLFAYLDEVIFKSGGRKFLEASPATNDAVSILQNMLLAEAGKTFEQFYCEYVGHLAHQDIAGIKKKVWTEFATTAGPISDFGFETTGSVATTGVSVYTFEAPSHPSNLAFMRVAQNGGNRTPSAVLAHGKQDILPLFPGAWSDIDKFKGKQTAVLVVTDAAITFQEDGTAQYAASFFVPYIKVTDVEVESPVTVGMPSTTTLTYDLLGVPPGPTFGVQVFRSIKGPNKFQQVTQIGYDWAPGTNQTAELVFTPPAAGTYTMQHTAKTPNDSFTGEHEKSKFKAKVKAKN